MRVRDDRARFCDGALDGGARRAGHIPPGPGRAARAAQYARVVATRRRIGCIMSGIEFRSWKDPAEAVE